MTKPQPTLKLKKVPAEPQPPTSEQIAARATNAARSKVDVYGPRITYGTWRGAKKKAESFAKKLGVPVDDIKIIYQGQLVAKRDETDTERLERIQRSMENTYRNQKVRWEQRVREVLRHNQKVDIARVAVETATKDDDALIKELKSRGYLVSKAV